MSSVTGERNAGDGSPLERSRGRTPRGVLKRSPQTAENQYLKKIAGNYARANVFLCYGRRTCFIVIQIQINIHHRHTGLCSILYFVGLKGWRNNSYRTKEALDGNLTSPSVVIVRNVRIACTRSMEYCRKCVAVFSQNYKCRRPAEHGTTVKHFPFIEVAAFMSNAV